MLLIEQNISALDYSDNRIKHFHITIIVTNILQSLVIICNRWQSLATLDLENCVDNESIREFWRHTNADADRETSTTT